MIRRITRSTAYGLKAASRSPVYFSACTCRSFSSSIGLLSAHGPIPRDPSSVQFIVGQIDKIENHPDAHLLYVSSVRLGSNDNRTVCSALKNKIPIGDLIDKRLVFVANLKPSKLRGVESNAMLLAGENETTNQIELVKPPDNCNVGDILQFEGYSAPDPINVRLLNSKVWTAIRKNLSIDQQGAVIYKGETPSFLIKMNEDLDKQSNASSMTIDSVAHLPTMRSGIVR